MKIKIHLLGIALLVLILAYALFTPTKAQSNPNRRSEAILIGFKSVLEPVPGGGNRIANYVVDWSSPSSGVVPPPPGTPLGETIAALLSAGFKIQFVNVDRYLLVRE